MLYGIPGTNDRASAYAAAITYWVFSCRDKKRSRASGFDKWSQLQTCIQNAAIPAQSVQQYMSQLSERLTVPTLIPSRFVRMLSHPDNQQTLWVGDRQGDELRQLTPDNSGNIFVSPEELLQDLMLQGITERHVLKLCKPVRFGGIPHVISMFCQGADQVHGFKPAEGEEAIEVETVDFNPALEQLELPEIAQTPAIKGKTQRSLKGLKNS